MVVFFGAIVHNDADVRVVSLAVVVVRIEKYSQPFPCRGKTEHVTGRVGVLHVPEHLLKKNTLNKYLIKY